MTTTASDMETTALQWNAMRDAPRDGTPLLLCHAKRGVIEGLFVPSHWTEDTPVSESQFQGAAWVLGQDQEEEVDVEEYGPDAPSPYHDGPLIGWLPRVVLPDAPEPTVEI